MDGWFFDSISCVITVHIVKFWKHVTFKFICLKTWRLVIFSLVHFPGVCFRLVKYNHYFFCILYFPCVCVCGDSNTHLFSFDRCSSGATQHSCDWSSHLHSGGGRRDHSSCVLQKTDRWGQRWLTSAQEHSVCQRLTARSVLFFSRHWQTSETTYKWWVSKCLICHINVVPKKSVLLYFDCKIIILSFCGSFHPVWK